MPAKYHVTTPADDRHRVKEQVIQAYNEDSRGQGGGSVLRTAPITEDEVSYVQNLEAEKRLAEFDAYVNTLIDPRKPGNLQWLMALYPGFVHRRVQQIYDDQNYVMKKQFIDNFGINTLDDLYFQYLNDQGIISGPAMTNSDKPESHFRPGALSFWKTTAGEYNRTQFPFSSSPYDAPSSSSKLTVPYQQAGVGSMARLLTQGGSQTGQGGGMFGGKVVAGAQGPPQAAVDASRRQWPAANQGGPDMAGLTAGAA